MAKVLSIGLSIKVVKLINQKQGIEKSTKSFYLASVVYGSIINYDIGLAMDLTIAKRKLKYEYS